MCVICLIATFDGVLGSLMHSGCVQGRNGERRAPGNGEGVPFWAERLRVMVGTKLKWQVGNISERGMAPAWLA